MTREEAKTVFLNRGYVEVEGGTIYDADKWRESCRVISEWLEQEPTVTSTEDNAEMIYPQVEGITPTVVKPLLDIDKKIESYKKLLKHPVIKHVMDMDETPVTLSVSENSNNCDLISREAVCDYIAEFINHEYSTQSECEMVDSMIDGIQHMQSVKPQEPCDVPDTNVGDIISKQTVLDTISELNAISFYEAQEDSKECYYEIRQAIENLSPVNPQEPKPVLYIGDGYADGYMVYDMAECPNCGYEYDYGDKDWGLSFCPSCGQKLNWESEE